MRLKRQANRRLEGMEGINHLAVILGDEFSSFVRQSRQRGIVPDCLSEHQRASFFVHSVVDFFDAWSGEHKSFQRLGVFGAKFGRNIERN